jgi:hypothetical protein
MQATAEFMRLSDTLMRKFPTPDNDIVQNREMARRCF